MRSVMSLNTGKIDDAVLALLYLTLHDGYRHGKASIGKHSTACTKRHDP